MVSSSSKHRSRVRFFALGLTLSLVLGISSRGFGEAPLVDLSVVPLYVGQEVTVEAQVRGGRRNGNVVRLQLEQAPRPIEVILVEGLLSRFPQNPEQRFVGQRIRASGAVREFRGRWEIIVRDPQNLALVTATESVVTAPRLQSTVQASPGAPLFALSQERWQQLEERLDHLEAAIRELRTAFAASESTGVPADAESCNERLRKIEFRLRQLEQKLEGRQ